MGILKFNGQLVKNMGITIQNAKQGQFPHKISGLMIDLNDLLHFFSQEVYLYGEFKNAPESKVRFRDSKSDLYLENMYIKKIINRLEFYINELTPEKYFIVAVDGPAPLAKIAQQRMRRIGGGDSRSSPRFDNASLSPGTEIMEKIHLSLKKWFYDKASKDSLPPVSIYSSYHEPGEGEHKMISYMLKYCPDVESYDGLHFICGQDSDLTMLGTTLSLKNVVHYREDREFEAQNGSPYADLIMVDLFKRYVYKAFMRDNTDVDFVLSYFVFGNDFIPKNPALKRADKTMEDISTAYIKNGKRLVDLKSGKIIRRNFLDFLEYLTPLEKINLDMQAATYNPRIQREYPILTNNTRKTKYNRIEVDLEGFKEDWYERALTVYNEMAFLDCETKGDCEEKRFKDINKFKRAMFENYLEMLQWNLDYYLGKHVSWNFQYEFYFAPLLSDLVELPKDGDILRHDDDWKEQSSILRQLIMISHPDKVKEFIPKRFHSSLLLPTIAKLSPESAVIYPDGNPKDKDYQFIKLLPLVRHEIYDFILNKYYKSIPDRMKVEFENDNIYLRKSSLEDDDNFIPGSRTIRVKTSKFIWTSKLIN